MSDTIAQAIDYHNDPELADVIPDVDVEFEATTGKTFDHAITTGEGDDQLARAWTDTLQRIADRRIVEWMAEEDVQMPTPDWIAAEASEADPMSAEQTVLWFAQQLQACRDAIHHWRFATVVRIKADFDVALYNLSNTAARNEIPPPNNRVF